MPFNYKPSPLGKRLPKKAEELIERIESYREWERRWELCKILNRQSVDVVLSDETKTIPLRPIKMTEEDMQEQLKKIDRQLEEISKAMAEYECSASEVETKQERAERCKKFGELQTKRNVLRQHQSVVSKALREHTRVIEPTMKVLGEYGNKEVTLYINNIGSDPYAYAMTYVHEMAHAYLDEGSSVVPEVEEPIAEFTMLKFLEIFGDKELYKYACNAVKNKQYAFGMAYYGFGAYLNETTRATFLDDYREAKASIPSDPKLPDYMKFWEKGDYPTWRERGCLNALQQLVYSSTSNMHTISNNSNPATVTNNSNTSTMIFKSLEECRKAIDLMKSHSLPVPQEWYDEEQIFLNGGTSSVTSSIYDYMCKNSTPPYSKELKQCIEDTVDHLLNPSNPNDDTSIPGLLLGRIQSGKTRAFIGVIALVFDQGFDACIVLTKPDNGLVAQTKARLENEFKHFADVTNPCTQNVIAIYDVNRSLTLSQRQLQFKNIFVLSKNSRLDAMKDLLNSSFANKKVLIIDDEADFVSRTFYSRKQQISGGVTGFRIDELMVNPQIICYYLQVTATPYTLLLQPDKETVDVYNGTLSCFHPRFTVLVPSHDDYIGGKEFFELSKNSRSMYSKLFHSISDECFDYLQYKNKDARVTSHPESHRAFADLRQALATYFVASAIRQMQELKSKNRVYMTSMLIHCAIEKGDHSHQQIIVNKILTFWKKEVDAGKWQNLRAFPNEFSEAYQDLVESINLGKRSNEISHKTYIPSENEVYKKLEDIFKQTEYTVKCVNGNTSDDPNLYMGNGQLKLQNLLNLFIGGYKADRGITIDHMIAFAYGRRPKNGGAANTILQHMRQYGNRSKEDMSVTRFHTTLSLYQKLEDIYYTDEALRCIFQHNAVPEAVCIDHNPKSGYRLCQPNQVLMSDMYGFAKFGRIIATGGMQTNTGISRAVRYLEAEIRALEPNEKTPFKVNKDTAIDWIRRIRQLFVYDDPKFNNKGIEWDEEIMIAAIEKYCPSDGEIWCYYKLNMGVSRVLSHKFSDAPEDGNIDTPVAKKKATDRPFLMLIGEKGDKKDGWLGNPFFWPVLRLPVDASSSIYCHGVIGNPRKNSRIEVVLPNGTIVAPGAKIADTMIECIKLADPAKVEALQIMYRKNNLVYRAGRCPKDYKTIVPGQFYLRKGFSVLQAQNALQQISNQLYLGWSINITQD